MRQGNKGPMTREELLNLIPAYAIGALDDDERAEFEAWLQGDPEAQMILADYRAVADHLVVLAPLRAAPAHLHADLRQRLTASRGAEAARGPVEIAPIVRRRLSRRATGALLAVAALVVIVLGILLVQIMSREEPDSTPSAAELYDELARQSGSSQYAVVPGEVEDTVWGDLIVSSDGEQAVLRISSLPQIGSDKAFQLWLVDTSGTRTSGGLFQGNPALDTVYIRVPIDRPIAAYQRFGVSLEPAGGSPYPDQPTGPRVFSVPLGE